MFLRHVGTRPSQSDAVQLAEHPDTNTGTLGPETHSTAGGSLNATLVELRNENCIADSNLVPFLIQVRVKYFGSRVPKVSGRNLEAD
jgi:hypothetical protein